MRDDGDNVSEYLRNFLNNIIEALPDILGALLILLIGYLVAKGVAAVVERALRAAHLNRLVHSAKGGSFIQRAVPNPSHLLARITFWLLFLFAISVAVSVLGIPALVELVNNIYAYVPNVLAAILIFLVAGAIAGGISTFVTNIMGDTPTGKIVATAAPIIVMGLATFMILDQLQIAPAIVTITYAGLVATAVLAFGLGGKEAAGRLMMNVYEAGRRKSEMAASDWRTGKERAKGKADDLKNKL